MRSWPHCGLIAAALLLGCVTGTRGQESVDELLRTALSLLRAGDAGSAQQIATRILERPGPPDATALWIRANALEQLEDYAKAVWDYGSLAEAEPNEPGVLLALGGARFKAGDITGSIDAFDSAARLDESLAPQLWQRGISHYYAGRLDDCIAQFELHRTVNPQDVENSVWHFLCAAARDGLDSARQALIPVERDARVPMAEVFRLFGGKGTAAEVTQAARDAESETAVFYEHLYLGLYFEATGDERLAKEHISKAAALKAPGNYMWHVARFHRELRDAAP